MTAASLHRRARDEEFRQSQWDNRYADHIAPINRFVDELCTEHPESWAPYVSPIHGGVQANIVLLLQDPGPMTNVDRGGSGFLSVENDDSTADRMATCMDAAGVTPMDVLPWNIHPWFRPEQTGLTTAHLVEGLDPLARLLALLPHVTSVVTCGLSATTGWGRFELRDPTTARGVRHFTTFHSSNLGINGGGKVHREERISHIVETLAAALATATPA